MKRFTGVQLVFVPLPPCKKQEENTSGKSLVIFEGNLALALLRGKHVVFERRRDKGTITK